MPTGGVFGLIGGQDRVDVVRRYGPGLLLSALGLWYLSNLHGAFFIDEALYADAGDAILRGAPYTNPTHMIAPTAKYFIGAGRVLFGPTSFGSRFPMALFGLLTVFVTYRIGVELRGEAAGLVAAALLGVTHFFATHSVMAMLDPPLAFFVAASFLAALTWLRTADRRHAALLGVLLAGSLTTKAYGFVYAVPLAAAVAVVAVSRRGLRRGARALLVPVAGGTATLGLVYLPYILIPHPPVGPIPNAFVRLFLGIPLLGGALEYYQVLQALDGLYSTPVLGNFLYVFQAFALQNLGHVEAGHHMIVGDTLYRYTPVWTYVYWLLDRAGIAAVLALGLVAVGGPVTFLRDRDPADAILWVATVLPLVGMSLLTVKIPRYVYPLVALLAVGGVHYAARLAPLLGRLVERGTLPSRRAARMGAVVLVVAVLLAPPSPIVASATGPINTDTRWDDVAAFVEDYAADRPGETVRVYAYHAMMIRYYAAGDLPNVDLEWIGGSSAAAPPVSALRGDGPVLVVDRRESPRLRRARPEFYRYVREHGTPRLVAPQTPPDREFMGTLVVYELQ